MTQTSLDMPDGLSPPFYTITYRYGTPGRMEWDELSDALSFLQSGEDYGDHHAHELGDAEGWLWRSAGLMKFEVSERAPEGFKKLPFIYDG